MFEASVRPYQKFDPGAAAGLAPSRPGDPRHPQALARYETPGSLRTKNRRPGRKAFAQLAHHECGLTMRMISEYLDISDQAVSRMIQAAERLEQHDPEYRRSLASIRKRLS